MTQLVGQKVFLCDDDAAYRHLVRAVLEASGAEIVGEGGDGAACILRAPAAGADVILLDVNMPRLDGWAALPELRAQAPDTEIVMLSSAPALGRPLSARPQPPMVGSPRKNR